MKRPFINVTIPVYNEERVLAGSVAKVARFLESNFRYPHVIVIVDNASTDRTLEIAKKLQVQFDAVFVTRLDEKGRGRAVKRIWRESRADVLS